MNIAEFSTKSTPNQAAIATINRMENSMGFVNELISQEDKCRLNPELYKSRLGRFPIRLSRWTIDREQNAFLLFTDGGREDIPEFYILTWRGHRILFSASVTGHGDRSTGIELSWCVFHVETPPEIEASRGELFELIRQALKAHGRFYSTEGIKSVDITIEQEGGVK